MENLIKGFYKNADDRHACLCLVQQDLKAFTTKVVRVTKPSTPDEEIDAAVSCLLDKSYTDFKNDEKSKRVNTLKKSFKKIMAKTSKCPCRRRGVNKLADFFAKYKSFRTKGKHAEQKLEHECKCHVTCCGQYKDTNILQSLEKFATVNRSFRMKYKYPQQDERNDALIIPYTKVNMDDYILQRNVSQVSFKDFNPNSSSDYNIANISYISVATVI